MEFENLDSLDEKSIVMVSAAGDCAEFNNVIQIIDEAGIEVACTTQKFVEIFDREGLSGFII